MARTKARLGDGERLSDHISLGVIAKYFPPGRIQEVVVMYYVIALSLYLPVSMTEVLRCLLEGLKWLWGAEAVATAGKSGITQATGAEVVWGVKKNLRLPVEQRLADGSYLSRVYPSEKDRRHGTNGVVLRVIEYRLPEIPDAEPLYRLATTILVPEAAPAAELAALYHERWEIETALDELKTHLRGARIVLRSKTPELVKQEFWGLPMAHYAVRALMHEAAVKGEVDPDELSYVHAVRVIKRRLPRFVAVSPSGAEAPA
jgi:hypothetical protein